MSIKSIQKKFGDDVIVHWRDRKRWCGLPLSFTRYYLIESEGKWIKLFCESGFFSSHVEEIQLYRIEDFNIHQSLTNKIWGVGSIYIKSNDKSAPQFKILRVAKPYQVYELLTTLVAKDRKDRNFRWGEFQG